MTGESQGNNVEDIKSDYHYREGNFQPSAETKRLYYALRKTPMNLGGFPMPGLFQYNPAHDKLWVMAALVFEVIGLVILAMMLLDQWYYLIPLIFVAIFLDLLAAYFHHHSRMRQSIIDNSLLLLFPDMRVGQARGKTLYKDYRSFLLTTESEKSKGAEFLSRFCGAFILIFALLKCLVLFANFKYGLSWDTAAGDDSTQGSIVPIIALLVFYLMVAYIHINYTGYYLSWLFFRFKFRQEKKVFDITGYNSQHERQEFSKDFDFAKFVSELEATGYAMWQDIIPKDESIIREALEKGLNTGMDSYKDTVFPHLIRLKNPSDQGCTKYTIVARGLLEDEALQSMVAAQPTDMARSAVAIWGHYVQLLSLEAPAPTTGQV